jgi:protein ImuA
MPAANQHIILRQLQKEILPLQGFKPPTAGRAVDFDLGPLERAFPNGRFPTGAMHELISRSPEQAAATSGFLAALLGPLLKRGGVCLWIGTRLPIFPPGLALFGIEPDRLLFVRPAKDKDLLWTIEEALKCEALAAVVGEIREISFTDSRRLQLAVEHSRVTGFLLRHAPAALATVAAVARWEILPLPSVVEEGLPGVGFPRWQVSLPKVRNGTPGVWQLEWSAGRFRFPEAMAASLERAIAASPAWATAVTPEGGPWKRRTG